MVRYEPTKNDIVRGYRLQAPQRRAWAEAVEARDRWDPARFYLSCFRAGVNPAELDPILLEHALAEQIMMKRKFLPNSLSR